MSDIGMTGSHLNERAAAFAALSKEQIKAALIAAGIAARTIARHGNIYNQMRCGHVDAVVGTLKAGASPRKHKEARRLLRKALRPMVPHL